MVKNACRDLRGYDLLHEGALALAEIENTGIRIDEQHCQNMSKFLDKKIKKLEERILQSEEVKVWKQTFRNKFNLESGAQLAHVLFQELGYEPVVFTDKGSPSTSEEALEKCHCHIAKQIVEYRRLKKVNSTYLKNLIEETVDGYLHPFFDLHFVSTFRSSSSRINFQNIPIRIPEISRIIRKAIVPRPGRVIVEIDYSGIEVRISCAYHKDETMITYIKDPTKDMHRDMGAQIYILSEDDVPYMVRYAAKNGYVFPEFYGSYYKQVAPDLWAKIDTLNLETNDGMPLKTHLVNNGIKNYGQFEMHIEEVEKDYWGRRFKTFGDWRVSQWEQYLKNGYVDLITGFRCLGPMKRNETFNYPIQGAAFHCLLWSLIHLHKETKSWETDIIGQIHDSTIADVAYNELDDFIGVAKEIMTQEIRKKWHWINVPLDIEVEVSPRDRTWFDKKEVTKKEDHGCGTNYLYKDERCPLCLPSK